MTKPFQAAASTARKAQIYPHFIFQDLLDNPIIKAQFAAIFALAKAYI